MSDSFTRDDLAHELMAASDLAEYFGVSRQTISNWRKRGVAMPDPVASIAGGSTLVYLRRDVAEWKYENIEEVVTTTVIRKRRGLKRRQA